MKVLHEMYIYYHISESLSEIDSHNNKSTKENIFFIYRLDNVETRPSTFLCW